MLSAKYLKVKEFGTFFVPNSFFVRIRSLRSLFSTKHLAFSTSVLHFFIYFPNNIEELKIL